MQKNNAEIPVGRQFFSKNNTLRSHLHISVSCKISNR